MATATQNRIIDDARMDCPGSTTGIIEMKLYDVLKEFFARSNSWLFELIVPVIMTANDYELDVAQPGVIINRLVSINRPTIPPPVPPVYLPMTPPQYLQLWTTEGQFGTQQAINPLYSVPRDAILLNAGTANPIMRIRWNPQANELWIVTLALNINDPTDAEGLPRVPDWILDKYFDYIGSGVKSRLMLQAGKPYSSQPGAAFHGRKFNEGVGLARNEIRDMFVYSSQRWCYPQGWTARRPRVS